MMLFDAHIVWIRFLEFKIVVKLPKISIPGFAGGTISLLCGNQFFASVKHVGIDLDAVAKIIEHDFSLVWQFA